MEDPAVRKAQLALIRQAMPRVAVMVQDKRRQLGDDHVTVCQARGMAGEPGWFYAREGAIAVGRLWPEALEAEAAAMPAGIDPAGVAIVCLRPKGGAA